MPRKVEEQEKIECINMIIDGVPQREIERLTNLSRPYIRKLAREIGFEFPINGIDIVGELCCCSNCGSFFRRPHSKVENKKHHFCDLYCKNVFYAGINHPSWKHGKTADSFSKWIVNQSGYQTWKSEVLANANYKCQISGREDNLDCHHILLKSINPEEALNPSNGMVLNKEVHQEMHSLMHQGKSFEEAVKQLKEKYFGDKNDSRQI